MGDPAGIGPDITLKSWLRRIETGLPAFCYLGDAGQLERRARELRLDVKIATLTNFSEASEVFRSALPVLHTPLPEEITAGRPAAPAAAAIISAIDLGAGFALSGEAAALVTNPIAKHVVRQAGFAHPGHTEHLAHLARARGHQAKPVMMLAAPALRVAPVTIHVALKDVPGLLTEELIIDTAEVLVNGLQRLFGLERPRLAVAGLNPHAGEDGLFGREEIEIIAPAVAKLKAFGYAVTGPHAADSLFHERARQGYDAVLAMYHDQALIPLKTLAFDQGVNVTLGLPFIRTSPDHGVAFDIAGTGRARPDSLMHALRLARSMAMAQLAPSRGGRM